MTPLGSTPRASARPQARDETLHARDRLKVFRITLSSGTRTPVRSSTNAMICMSPIESINPPSMSFVLCIHRDAAIAADDLALNEGDQLSADGHSSSTSSVVRGAAAASAWRSVFPVDVLGRSARKMNFSGIM